MASHPTSKSHLSRRSFLQIGALGLGGLTLPQLLRAEQAAGIRSSPKSVILIYLVGGPPHQDMFDLKPDAPQEIAGPWRPIATNVTGIQICEAFPRLARMMDKLAVVRSLVGNQADHDAIQVFNGHHPRKPTPVGRLAAVRLRRSPRLQGPADPRHAAVHQPVLHLHARPVQRAGPRLPRRGASRRSARWARRATTWSCSGVTSTASPTAGRCCASFDGIRRDVDATGTMQGMDAFTEQAFGLLTSSRLAEALDLSQEDPRIVARYGTGDPKIFMDGNGAPRVPQSLLMARRLIEAGARVVTLNYSKWDWHGGMNAEGRANNSIFLREAEDFPVFDQCVSALVEDLHQRGLDRGLHGRHHGRVRPHAEDQRPGRPRPLAAGQLRPAGRRRHEDRPGDRRDRPHRRRSGRAAGHVRRTVRHALPQPRHRRRTTRRITDLNGRPQYLVEDHAQPLRELV